MINYKKLLAFCLSIVLVFTTACCKPAPALEETIHDLRADNKDNSLDIIENDIKNNDTDENLSPTQSEDNEKNSNQRDRTRDKAKNSDSNANNDLTGDIPKKVEFTGENNDNAEPDNEENNSDSSTPDTDSSNDNQAKQNDDTQINDNNPNDIDNIDDSSKKRIVESNGLMIEIPENVERIAATGDVASIIYMLGGNNLLVGTSESFTNNYLANKYLCSADTNVQPETLWSYDGSNSIGDDEFQSLLELKPQVCFELSGENTFTSDQVAKLAENDIVYFVLPNLKTLDNLKKTVSIVGEVIGDKSSKDGKNALQTAKEYNSYVDSMISNLSGRVDKATYDLVDFNNDKTTNGTKKLESSSNDTTSGDFHGVYSLYINAWDDYATYCVYNNANTYLSGNGLAVAKSGYSYSPLSYYMSLAGVINTAAIYPDFGPTTNWYVNPLIPTTKSVNLSGNCTNPNGYYLTLTDNDISNNSGKRENGLGNKDKFYAIIAENNTIRNRIINSELWHSYGYVTSASNISGNFGILDSDGGIIESSIIDDYEIFVNPTGISSWSSGSPESILETMWLAWKFYGAYSEDDVRNEVYNFYNKFYNIDLDNSEIDMILNGAD